MISVKHILCPVDLSDCSQLALSHAVALGSWYDARVTALHVFSEVPILGPVAMPGAVALPAVSVHEVDRDAVFNCLRKFVASVSRDNAVEIELAEAVDARREILEQIKILNADLLVMGTHGRSGFDHLLLGSVTEKVMRQATCPVMVVPRHAAKAAAPSSPPFKRIVCPIDFSSSSIHALSFALDIAQESDAKISLLHAIEMPPELSEVTFGKEPDVYAIRAAAEAEYLRRLRALIPFEARTYCTITTQVAEGRAHQEILRVAGEEQADLIVMGVRGRRSVGVMIFGSNTDAVIKAARCPVLAVPAA
jgi:nucleotide-binding universal stress UspA family protein